MGLVPNHHWYWVINLFLYEIMQKLSKEYFLEGQILLIDKPLTWSSFQAVNKIKYALLKNLDLPKKFKIGHAGTLDPLASGLLIICTGKFTKRIAELQGQVKKYTGTITVGATTPSYDLETEINQEFPTDHISNELIEETRKKFIGIIDQFFSVEERRKTFVRTCACWRRSGNSIEKN